MDTAERLDDVRRAYARGSHDTEFVLQHCTPDVVFHVPGRHPLAGDHSGVDAVRRYLGAVAEVLGGSGGFTVLSCFTDPVSGEVLVEGSAWYAEIGGSPQVRTVVHLLRIVDGRLAELWEHPFEPRVEDQFWRERSAGLSLAVLPAQRRPPVAEGSTPPRA